MKLFLILLCAGMLQMTIARVIGVHDGLEHMVFTHWWEYALEGLFYSFFWWLIVSWLKQQQPHEAEQWKTKG